MPSQKLLIGLILLLLGTLAITLFANATLSGDMVANFAYLALVMTMLASWGLAELRGNLGNTLRNLIIWGVIIIVLMLGYQNRALLGL